MKTLKLIVIRHLHRVGERITSRVSNRQHCVFHVELRRWGLSILLIVLLLLWSLTSWSVTICFVIVGLLILLLLVLLTPLVLILLLTLFLASLLLLLILSISSLLLGHDALLCSESLLDSLSSSISQLLLILSFCDPLGVVQLLINLILALLSLQRIKLPLLLLT